MARPAPTCCRLSCNGRFARAVAGQTLKLPGQAPPPRAATPSTGTSGRRHGGSAFSGRGKGRRASTTAVSAASAPAPPPPPPPPDPIPAPTSLADAAAVFAAHPTPRLILAVLAALAAARAGLAVDGRHALSALDAAAALAGVAGWVAAEPGVHAALHLPGWPGAAVHAAHHAAPYHHVSIDPPGLVAAWVAAVAAATAAAVAAGAAPPGPAASGLAGYCGAGLAYEAVHFGAHCAFAPPWAWARALRAHHKRHHLHSEAHWLAFSAPWLDALAGRAPARPGDVPRGPMAEAARARAVEERAAAAAATAAARRRQRA